VKEEIYHLMAQVESRHWWFEGRRRIVDHFLADLGLSPEASILEIGCGTGGNFEVLSKYGELSAVDIDATALRYASERTLADVRQGALPDEMPFGDDRFDLVVLLDVLEHVDEDQAALHRVRKLMRPGGCLMLTVPAFPFLWSAHDEVHEHKRRYTRGDLVQQVGAAGIRVTRASYFNSWLFPLVAAVRLGGRVVAHNAVADLSVPPNALNWALTKVMASERHTMSRFSHPVGVSLLLQGRLDG
jgi:SAM-dependent methyltransferase